MAKTVGLVLEGGGMRGSYTLGILDVFLAKPPLLPLCHRRVGRACNAASYVSRQIGRGERIAETYGMDRRYVSPLNLLGREHSMFGMDFIFDEIPDVHDPFDYDAFYRTGTRMVIGCTDVVTGKALYVDTPPRATLNTYYRASSSIPLFSPMVRVDGHTLLDGGTADPIPFDEALRHCDKVLVVLTRGREYVKKPAPAPWIYRRALRAYPNMSRTCARPPPGLQRPARAACGPRRRGQGPGLLPGPHGHRRLRAPARAPARRLRQRPRPGAGAPGRGARLPRRQRDASRIGKKRPPKRKVSAGPFALFWGYTLTSASTDTSPSRSNTGWMESRRNSSTCSGQRADVELWGRARPRAARASCRRPGPRPGGRAGRRARPPPSCGGRPPWSAGGCARAGPGGRRRA